MYTQGYFVCTKCGKRPRKTYRRQRKKIGIIIGIISVIVVGYFLIHPYATQTEVIIPIPKLSPLPNIPLPTSMPIHVPNFTEIASKPQQLLQEVTTPQQTTQDDSKQAIDYINTIRASYGVNPIQFDQRAFALGLARAKDMYDYGYLDHVNPQTGSCPYSIKSQYGFAENEYVAENALGYETKQEVSYSNGDYHQNIESWMSDTGHKMNLLYYDHYGGAYACYGSQCVFEGVNHDQFGLGCHTAAEGTATWNSMATCTDAQLMQYQALQKQLDAMKPQLQGMPSVATSQEQYNYYNGLVSQYNNLVNQINNFHC